MKRLSIIFFVTILFLVYGCENRDVTGVNVSPQFTLLRTQETVLLTATVTPDNAKDNSVKWVTTNVWPHDTSKKENVSIHPNGPVQAMVRAEKEGISIITCITNDAGFEKDVMVAVGYSAFASGLYRGTTRQNGIIAIPDNATLTLERTGEYEANFNFPYQFANTDTKVILSKPVTVDYFSGNLVIHNVNDDMEISGTIEINGIVFFNVKMGDTATFDFMGAKSSPYQD